MVKKISGRVESPPPARSSLQNRAFSHFFGLQFPYMARDPIIFLANSITFCALNKWSKFGKNGRCLNIFKTKKTPLFLALSYCSHSKMHAVRMHFLNNLVRWPQFLSTIVLHPCSCINMKKFHSFGRCFKNLSIGVKQLVRPIRASIFSLHGIMNKCIR